VGVGAPCLKFGALVQLGFVTWIVYTSTRYCSFNCGHYQYVSEADILFVRFGCKYYDKGRHDLGLSALIMVGMWQW
jgi:hypothetical protein